MSRCTILHYGSALIAAALLQCYPALAAQQHFQADPDASEITAAVAEPLSSLRGDAVGRFRLLSCDIYQDPQRAADDRANVWVEAVVDASSYQSGSSMRDDSVKDSVLDVNDFPTITFKGGSSWTAAKHSSDTSGAATLKGELTLHGAVRPFEVPVQVSLADDKLIGEGEVSFNYTDFGIDRPTILGLKAGNMVKVTYHIVATRAPEGR